MLGDALADHAQRGRPRPDRPRGAAERPRRPRRRALRPPPARRCRADPDEVEGRLPRKASDSGDPQGRAAKASSWNGAPTRRPRRLLPPPPRDPPPARRPDPAEELHPRLRASSSTPAAAASGLVHDAGEPVAAAVFLTHGAHGHLQVRRLAAAAWQTAQQPADAGSDPRARRARLRALRLRPHRPRQRGPATVQALARRRGGPARLHLHDRARAARRAVTERAGDDDHDPPQPGRSSAASPARCCTAMSAEPTTARPDLSVVVRGEGAVARQTLDDALASRGWIEAEGFLSGSGDALPPTRGRYVLLLAPEVEITGGNLAELVAAMDARPRCGLAGVVAPTPLRKLGKAVRTGGRPAGDLTIARAEALEEVGAPGPDADWSAPLEAAGWEVGHLPVVTVARRGGAAVPAELDDRELREERYRERSERRSLLMATYYNLKPLLPRALQLAMRRRYAKRQARAEFPRWPIEPILVERRAGRAARRAATERRERAAAGSRPGPTATASPRSSPTTSRGRRASPWSADHGDRAAPRLPLLLELRRRVVPDRGRACSTTSAPPAARSACTGSSTTASCSRAAPTSRRSCRRSTAKLAEWDAVGFRSPATHRNADWMEELGAAYDSSFPDTDPFEPLGRRLLLDPALLPRRDGRAADHPGPGPHPVGDPAAATRSTSGPRRATGSPPTAA